VAVGSATTTIIAGSVPDAGDSAGPGTTLTGRPNSTTATTTKKTTPTTLLGHATVAVTVPATAAPAAAPPPGASPPTTAEQPVPYDPSKPINLCCVPGVTPQEQARAEQLVRATLAALPHWANSSTAVAEGYRSIGDGDSGDEHFVKWSLLDDGHILDPSRPESLVYENGKLVAAMFMLGTGSTFANVPDVGGPLTQWHVHNDLCLRQSNTDPLQWLLSGKTDSNGHCPPGTQKKGNVPMIHVWIIANPCGPFAGLKGEGGGQVPPGQKPLCDKAHGA
jgi:hypothetical protein